MIISSRRRREGEEEYNPLLYSYTNIFVIFLPQNLKNFTEPNRINFTNDLINEKAERERERERGKSLSSPLEHNKCGLWGPLFDRTVKI